MKQYLDLYKNELLNNVIPFWEKNSPDNAYGGFFTCLNRQGEVYDTDKYVWLQARQVWMFAIMYDQVEAKKEWLNLAKQGAEFLIMHGRDDNGAFYFSLDQKGSPLIQPYNIFSDCFAAMAFAALNKVEPNESYASLAVNTFENILRRRDNPKGIYNKTFPRTRDLKSFALPMILSNLTLEMESLLDREKVEELVPSVIHEVMEVFYQKESGLILENVNLDGSFSNSHEGRLTSPGHAIEAMWFMLDLSQKYKDEELCQKAITIGLKTLEYGWDKEYGGIYYFLDILGHPSEKLEWNQKLWWVHLETLVFLSKAYAITGNNDCLQWFYKVHEYTWDHFKDPDSAEWFGYLDRYGKIQLPLKGGKWKGCFHVPRGLFQVWKSLEKIQ
ncbi:MAG: AGE family epimerase/isomerase [Cytophagales bacterium]|uniref:AGE family epimerase/isomerase n=1 Tax=Cyclobacterium marinum TaxID=104 RepID=UPI0030DCDE8D|nr:AGE family epimerase/isomerase [Cytophagales bacterium]|tara:strand:+ start:64568 stop:65725 length:1158 start_codon:yes stop_codon:yes gene_type:complete